MGALAVEFELMRACVCGALVVYPVKPGGGNSPENPAKLLRTPTTRVDAPCPGSSVLHSHLAPPLFHSHRILPAKRTSPSLPCTASLPAAVIQCRSTTCSQSPHVPQRGKPDGEASEPGGSWMPAGDEGSVGQMVTYVQKLRYRAAVVLTRRGGVRALAL